VALPAYQLLKSEQLRLIDQWLGEWELEADMSWGVQGILVLRIAAPGGSVVVKASDVTHHIKREIRAYLQMTAPLGDHAPRLLHADARAGVVVTSWLPGTLVEGGPFEYSPDHFRQAGALLARLHVPRQETRSYDPAALHKIDDFARRAGPLVPAPLLSAVRGMAAAHVAAPRVLYATHGDYQPRNWIHDDGRLSVIDFGRAGYRPWVTDFVRLEHSYFADHPDLRAAFLSGYGRDPAEESDSWRLDNILQSLGTVVWAHDVGDRLFEAAGLRMLERVAERFA
jgi:aminoglycoside phosphotransferase (APT) family kinase protein